jgi:hypothetical protein
MGSLQKRINLTEIILLLDIDKFNFILRESNISLDNIIKYAISSQNSSNPELEKRLAKILDWQLSSDNSQSTLIGSIENTSIWIYDTIRNYSESLHMNITDFE